jgi:hypothetical protein
MHGCCSAVCGSARNALQNNRITLHQPFVLYVVGRVSDIVLNANKMEREKAALIRITAKHTGQPDDVLERKMDRDFCLTPEDAVQAVSFSSVQAVLFLLPFFAFAGHLSTCAGLPTGSSSSSSPPPDDSMPASISALLAPSRPYLT